MKPWMKILTLLGLGFGLGFFAGQQVGQRMGRSEKYEEEYEEDRCVPEEDEADRERDAEYALLGYREGLDEILETPATDDEDLEMPTAEDIQIDPDIPQLHPEDLKPEIIGEEEYNANIWQYDLENLIFYEMDEVLYNETTQSIVETPDQVIGIGTLFEFGGDPNNPVDTIYVKNDTFGTLFRIDRVDAAFCDAVDGSCPPEDDAPENDAFWDDV